MNSTSILSESNCIKNQRMRNNHWECDCVMSKCATHTFVSCSVCKNVIVCQMTLYASGSASS